LNPKRNESRTNKSLSHDLQIGRISYETEDYGRSQNDQLEIESGTAS